MKKLHGFTAEDGKEYYIVAPTPQQKRDAAMVMKAETFAQVRAGVPLAETLRKALLEGPDGESIKADLAEMAEIDKVRREKFEVFEKEKAEGKDVSELEEEIRDLAERYFELDDKNFGDSIRLTADHQGREKWYDWHTLTLSQADGKPLYSGKNFQEKFDALQNMLEEFDENKENVRIFHRLRNYFIAYLNNPKIDEPLWEKLDKELDKAGL